MPPSRGCGRKVEGTCVEVHSYVPGGEASRQSLVVQIGSSLSSDISVWQLNQLVIIYAGSRIM